ncbi:MAG: prolipoprotein diacylglyceryl transferase [Dehalococcoidia bacterium]|nr:prolipoprotein diacylglyceryl transferase [Dehalococcoidia bacterium]
MLTISVDPVAFTIGSMEVRWYGIMVALAVATLLAVMVREGKRIGITTDLYSIFLVGIIGGVVGGRAAHVIHHWEYYAEYPQRIIGFAGLAQNGMIVGVIVAALIYMWATKMRFSALLKMGDALAVGAPLALAVARIGCTLNGCCHGKPSPFQYFPGAVIYTARDAIPRFWNGISLYQNGLTVPLYPTQIYHIWLNLVLFAIIWRLRDRFKPTGGLVFFYFSIQAATDFALRFLRVSDPVVLNLEQGQLLSLGILAVFLPWFIIRIRRYRPPESDADSPGDASALA